MNLLSMASDSLTTRLQMLDSLVADAKDGAKFMATLSQEKVNCVQLENEGNIMHYISVHLQMKELLLCMHNMTLTEPLTNDKKVLEIRKRLACEVVAKMKGEPADKCAQ